MSARLFKEHFNPHNQVFVPRTSASPKHTQTGYGTHRTLSHYSSTQASQQLFKNISHNHKQHQQLLQHHCRDTQLSSGTSYHQSSSHASKLFALQRHLSNNSLHSTGVLVKPTTPQSPSKSPVKTKKTRNNNLKKLGQMQELTYQLYSDVQLQRMVVSNAAEIIQVMTAFYTSAFSEICDDFGFNLAKLSTVRSVLCDSQMQGFRAQLQKLKGLAQTVGQDLPSIGVLTSFLELLEKLKRSLAEHEQEATGLSLEIQDHALLKDTQRVELEQMRALKEKKMREQVHQIGRDIKRLHLASAHDQQTLGQGRSNVAEQIPKDFLQTQQPRQIRQPKKRLFATDCSSSNYVSSSQITACRPEGSEGMSDEDQVTPASTINAPSNSGLIEQDKLLSLEKLVQPKIDVRMNPDDDAGNHMEELPFLKKDPRKKRLNLKPKAAKRAPSEAEIPQHIESASVEKMLSKKRRKQPLALVRRSMDCSSILYHQDKVAKMPQSFCEQTKTLTSTTCVTQSSISPLGTTTCTTLVVDDNSPSACNKTENDQFQTMVQPATVPHRRSVYATERKATDGSEDAYQHSATTHRLFTNSTDKLDQHNPEQAPWRRSSQKSLTNHQQQDSKVTGSINLLYKLSQKQLQNAKHANKKQVSLMRHTYDQLDGENHQSQSPPKRKMLSRHDSVPTFQKTLKDAYLKQLQPTPSKRKAFQQQRHTRKPGSLRKSYDSYHPSLSQNNSSEQSLTRRPTQTQTTHLLPRIAKYQEKSNFSSAIFKMA